MSVNRCIKCDSIIPEGRLSCPNCEHIENNDLYFKEENIMYELIKRILDTSRDELVDIGVAYDMIANDIGYTEELKEAFVFLKRYYGEITSFRTAGKEEKIEEMCNSFKTKGLIAVEDFIDEHGDLND